jgi:glycerophosphoryl diester phosphodiesterase
MPFEEYRSFKDIIVRAHEQGKKVRVYNIPEQENIWDVLYTAGVDMISGSDPVKFHQFLESKK